jgi:chorismate dehydratase
MAALPAQSSVLSPQSYSVGAVSYLNSRPLIYGLAEQRDIRLALDVPARLLDGLRSRRFDVALLPVIDYQRLDGLEIVPAGGIGSNGAALTVRIFSSVPIAAITELACDEESHTSVALAQIILAELYGIGPRFIPGNQPASARLLIGDKVICDAPIGMDHQLDLGAAWKELTGLPFVFAVWTARGGVDLADLPARLAMALQLGMQNLDQIIAQHAIPRGWPHELARQYLTGYMRFEISSDHLRAIAHFHNLAAHHGIITAPPKPLIVYPGENLSPLDATTSLPI